MEKNIDEEIKIECPDDVIKVSYYIAKVVIAGILLIIAMFLIWVSIMNILDNSSVFWCTLIFLGGIVFAALLIKHITQIK